MFTVDSFSFSMFSSFLSAELKFSCWFVTGCCKDRRKFFHMLLSEFMLKAAASFDDQSGLTSCTGETVSCVELIKLVLVAA